MEKEATSASLVSKGRNIPALPDALTVMSAFVTEARRGGEDGVTFSCNFEGGETIVIRAEDGLLYLVSTVPKG